MSEARWVAIQGLAGSYSEEALRSYWPASRPLCLGTFSEVFAALRSGQVETAFLPFENATAGFIAENYSFLAESELQASAAYVHSVVHCLLVKPGTQRSDIQSVRSHPQALKQCSRYLQKTSWTPMAHFDTAGAARDLGAREAAIASARAAEIYGCDILEHGIQDQPGNATRFFVIEKHQAWGNRLVVILEREDLFRFQEGGLQLVSALSLPLNDRLWAHRYCVELATSGAEQSQRLAQRLPSSAVLGSFDATALCPS